MKTKFLAGLTYAACLTVGMNAYSATDKPTIVLVHGAFADASSWNAVAEILRKDDYPVIAAANPLRSVSTDAAAVASLVSHIDGPVVLVGHSYGGSVITVAADRQPNVKSLVYVSAFEPDLGESAAMLAGKYPGGTLGPALAPPVRLSNGDKDLYIQQDKFPAQFAADVPNDKAALMAATQRPITEAALNENISVAAWHRIPSYAIYGDADKNIPPAAMAFMAQRANSKETIVIPGGSHVIMVSNPHAVADMIEQAAKAK